VAQAGVGVLELGEGDLELGLVGAGAGGEDVEDQLAAVEDFAVADFFEIAELVGGHVVIEDHDIGFVGFDALGDFLGLAVTDVGAGIDGVAGLGEGIDDESAGGFGEGGEFAEGVARIVGGIGEEDADEDGAFGADGDGGAFILTQGEAFRG
jgi:hypothetical protein